MGRIGEDALSFSGPQSLYIDDEGNFYLAIWTPGGAVKLDSDGNLIAYYGVEVDDNDSEPPEGGMVMPAAAAALPDGSRVFIADSSGKYSYLTAFAR